jgi:hypothetical protein
VRTPQGKRLFRSHRRRWEYNIKMVNREIGWDMDWIDVTQDRERWYSFVNVVINPRVPLNVGNCLASLGNISWSRITLLRRVS